MAGNHCMDWGCAAFFETRDNLEASGIRVVGAGKNIADPTAAILSAALLLNHLNNPVAASRIEAAVAADLATRDAKKRSTTEVAEAIFALL